MVTRDAVRRDPRRLALLRLIAEPVVASLVAFGQRAQRLRGNVLGFRLRPRYGRRPVAEHQVVGCVVPTQPTLFRVLHLGEWEVDLGRLVHIASL